VTPFVRFGPILLLCFLLVGCGGSTSSSTNTPTPTTPAPTTGGTGTAPAGTPTVVNVSQGQTLTGVDVTVSTPAGTPAPNAENLGVNNVTGRASAANTGGVIHRGSTMRVVLFGAGLNGSMKVTIGGPGDVTVSNVSAVQATDNTPGISFNATASSNASLGARSVFLQTSAGDITSFTGGLEVVP
jgi:hypothetical protein